MSLVLIHNPQCSKSRETLSLLEQSGVLFEVREYKQAPLSLEELMLLLRDLRNSEPHDLVRIKDSAFEAHPFDTGDTNEIVTQLAKRPELLERPILWKKGKFAEICRPPEKLHQLLANL